METYSTQDETTLYAILAVYGFIFVLLLIAGLCNIITKWVIFKKAGQPGWGILVPFYNIYLMQIIAFPKEKWPFIFLLLLPGVNAVYGIYLQYSFARSYGLSTGGSIAYLFFSPIMNFYLAFSGQVTYQGTQDFFIK